MYVEWIVIGGLVLVLLWMQAGMTMLRDRIDKVEDELKSNQQGFKEVGEEIDKLWAEQR